MKPRVALSTFAFFLAASGCGDDHGHPHAPAPAPKTGTPAPEGHAGHGKPMPLGDATAGPFKLSATRDEGALKAGGEAAIDVRVVSAANDGLRPQTVRFWIGTADAKGSIKAKADIEDPKDPDRWHTHAEIPDPFAADAKLFVEVEVAGGAKHVASFALAR